MTKFLTKLFAVAMALATVLVFDGLLQGMVSGWAALALLPAFGLMTARLFRVALRRTGRRTARRAAAGTAHRAPALRVAPGGSHPHGPRAA